LGRGSRNDVGDNWNVRRHRFLTMN
jgi:hypothetical protein